MESYTLEGFVSTLSTAMVADVPSYGQPSEVDWWGQRHIRGILTSGSIRESYFTSTDTVLDTNTGRSTSQLYIRGETAIEKQPVYLGYVLDTVNHDSQGVVHTSFSICTIAPASCSTELLSHVASQASPDALQENARMLGAPFTTRSKPLPVHKPSNFGEAIALIAGYRLHAGAIAETQQNLYLSRSMADIISLKK